MTSTTTDTCEICEGTQTEDGVCDFCEFLTPHILQLETGVIRDAKKIESFRKELNYPNTKIPQVWSRVRALGEEKAPVRFPEPEEKQWFFGEPPEWAPSDEDISAISTWRTKRIEDNRARKLARGGTLPDGTHISFAGGIFYVDGHPCRVPYVGLNKVISRHRRLSKSINWKLLLRSIDLALTRMHSREFRGTPRPRSIFHQAARIVYPNAVEREMFRFDGPPYETPYDRQPRNLFSGATWLSRWDSMEDREISGMEPRNLKVPENLFEKKGKLFLRVRRNNSWRRIEVESDPRTWEIIVSWVLSPPEHGDHLRIRMLQQHIFTEEPYSNFTQSDINGIRFLREVIEYHDRATLDTSGDNGGRISVEGTSGLHYYIIPGRGGHGTRFTVVPGRTNQDTSDQPRPNDPYAWMMWRRMRRSAICIVETPRLRRLVLGDALGSVTLTLLDDLQSQRHINTLSSHIRENLKQPTDPEIRQHQRAVELRQMLRTNRIEIERNRVTESFPRLFSVLLRLPLGSRVTFTAMNRDQTPNISFDECETTFTTRNQNERRVVYRMLEASGWSRDGFEERVRGVSRVYIRLGTGSRDLTEAVDQISELLEPTMNITDRVRIVAGPLWRFFERQNPITISANVHLLPGTDAHIP